jgi:murein DD-endopeptidase MepM/ murein hydrolase activator NlpD
MTPGPLAVAGLAAATGLIGLAGLIAPAAPAGSAPPVLAGVVPVSAAPPPGRRAPLARPAPRPVFQWPLSPSPPVLRRFVLGPRPWSPGHRGVDLGAREGQEVLSAGAGVVTFAGVVAGRGVVAVLHPGGVRTTYEPVTSPLRAGQAVAAGAVLGSLATGGHCRQACLHWGALRADAYLDPLTLLRPPAPPVLLPLAALGRNQPAWPELS